MVECGWIWWDMVGYGWIWWDMVGYRRVWEDVVNMVGYGGTWWDNLSKATPKAAKVDPKSPKAVPKAPKGHPKGIQEAPKRLQGALPRNLTKKTLERLASGTQKACQKAPKITTISSNTTPFIHQIFQRIPTTFFVTFSRLPGCLDLLKHCACHAFRAIHKIDKL